MSGLLLLTGGFVLRVVERERGEGMEKRNEVYIYTYHAMPPKLRIRLENAVRGGIVARRVHGIGARLVEGGLDKSLHQPRPNSFSIA